MLFSNVKTKLSGLGFSINHYGLIAISLIIFLGLMFTTESLTLQNLTAFKFLKANNESVTEQTLPEVSVEEVATEAIDKLTAQKNELSSLLDPSFGQGSVLGENTEGKKALDATLSEQSLQAIPVMAVVDTENNIIDYVDQLQLLELYYGDLLILSSITTQDPAAAGKAIPLVKGLISELKSMKVPQSLVRYHRLKLMHYAVVMNMAQNIASNLSPEDKSAAGILFFEITNEMESEKAALIQKYEFEF